MSSRRRWFKWTIYALLVVDFLIYLAQDIQAAPYTLDDGSGLREILAAYVTSIDLAAWFTLILLFEVETGTMAGREWTGAARWAVRGLRFACCAAILHTSFAYDIALREFRDPLRLPAAADVCAYAGEWTLLRNREYLEINAGNCRTIAGGTEFFALSDDKVLTDRAGLREGAILAWTDLAESLAWLIVVLAIEAAVRLKSRPHMREGAMRALRHLTMGLYVLILAIAAYWGSKGQLLYFWDELLWVLGFLVIDGNLRAARERPGRVSASPRAA